MRILSVDDNLENLYLVEAIGRSHGHEIISVHNGVEALDQLRAGTFDLIISDILMPAMDGFELCRTVKCNERWKQIPFIFYTATYTAKQDEELALALGASRFIIKPADPEKFLAIIEHVVSEGETGQIPAPVPVDLQSGETLGLYNQVLVRKLERKVEQLETARAELAASVTEIERESSRRRLAEEKFSRAFMSSPAALSIHDPDESGNIIEVNEAFERITGYHRDEVIGRTLEEIGLLADPPERQDELHRQMRIGGAVRNVEQLFRRKNGDVGTGLFSIERFESGDRRYAVATNVDITDRIRAETEKSKLEAQLRQAQKLESIGRLAGGVAHDFNNLLTVITGYSDFLINQIAPGNPMRPWVDEIRQAAEHAAGLTQQLLAFSRKQVIAPEPLSLNSVVKEAERMLQRLIGEDIELAIRLDPGLEQTLVDRNQIHQVIMNLAVNARDAMPDGGRLVVETRNVYPDDKAAGEHPEAASRRQVVLSVSDTGSGIPDDVLQQIFEPFFTTKEHGKGTGLGLSTVYGIVEQSGGWIDVSSKVGGGTTFKIYLPVLDPTSAIESVKTEQTLDASKGSETVLVLEDNEGVRRLTTTLLRTCGYHVLESASAAEAIQMAERYSGQIHLLLTDVILTDINGKDLSERLRLSRPTLRVLFTSGYSDDVIAPRGVLDPTVAYIAKPFSRDALLLKIREVLSGGASSRHGEP